MHLTTVGSRVRLLSLPSDDRGFFLVGVTAEGSPIIKRALANGARPNLKAPATIVGWRHIAPYSA